MKRIFLFMFVILGCVHNSFASNATKNTLFKEGQKALVQNQYTKAITLFEQALVAEFKQLKFGDDDFSIVCQTEDDMNRFITLAIQLAQDLSESDNNTTTVSSSSQDLPKQ